MEETTSILIEGEEDRGWPSIHSGTIWAPVSSHLIVGIVGDFTCDGFDSLSREIWDYELFCGIDYEWDVKALS